MAAVTTALVLAVCASASRVFYLYALPLGESNSSWPGALLQVCSVALMIAAVASMPWSELRPGRGTGPLQLRRGHSAAVRSASHDAAN
jgi:hypothetical protein